MNFRIPLQLAAFGFAFTSLLLLLTDLAPDKVCLIFMGLAIILLAISTFKQQTEDPFMPRELARRHGSSRNV